MLINSQVTKTAILEAFDEYQDIMTKDDNLIFYFSGHGYYHGKRNTGYWLTSESESQNYATYLSNYEILKFIEHLDARHVFGIVDACFAGALFTDRAINEVASKRLESPSRWLLTAGQLGPVSDGEVGRNSPFTAALLAHLNYNNGSQIWVSDLCAKVLEGVKYNTDKQEPRGEPLKNVGHYGGDYVFVRKGFSFLPPKNIEIEVDNNSSIEKLNSSEKDNQFEIKDVENLKNKKSNLLQNLEENNFKIVFTDLKEMIVNEGKKRQILRQLIRNYNTILDSQMFGIVDDKSIELKYNQLGLKLAKFIEDLDSKDIK